MGPQQAEQTAEGRFVGPRPEAEDGAAGEDQFDGHNRIVETDRQQAGTGVLARDVLGAGAEVRCGKASLPGVEGGQGDALPGAELSRAETGVREAGEPLDPELSSGSAGARGSESFGRSGGGFGHETPQRIGRPLQGTQRVKDVIRRAVTLFIVWSISPRGRDVRAADGQAGDGRGE